MIVKKNLLKIMENGNILGYNVVDCFV